MKITNRNIEEYIHRFMEGETTNAEEQAIYRFFQKGDIPIHLKPYSDMFAWYEEGMPEEKLPKPTPQPIWKCIPPQLRSMRIAAILFIAIGLGIMLSFNNNNNQEDWACYEGSYVEVNGKRITDIKTIMPIILETLAEAEAIEKSIEERLAEIRYTEEEIAKQENIEFMND